MCVKTTKMLKKKNRIQTEKIRDFKSLFYQCINL